MDKAACQLSGEKLKSRRLAKGWSQRRLSQHAGVSHTSIQYWEAKPTIDPSGYAVKRMADALGWQISAHLNARARHGVLSEAKEAQAILSILDRMPRKLVQRLVAPRVRCGAKTRTGTECAMLSVPGKRRFRLHGGLSTGPRTRKGRESISKVQRKRWSITKGFGQNGKE